MDIGVRNKKIAKGMLITILVLICAASTFLFINALQMKYKTHTEITTIYKDSRKRVSDSEIMITIETEDGFFKIDNIISNNSLYSEIQSTLHEDDEIVIYYYDKNWVLGIQKGENIILDVTKSIEKLSKNDRLWLFALPGILLVSAAMIIYVLKRKSTT